MLHSVGGVRHPSGPEPRGNSNSGGTGSRTSGGAGAGAGAGTPGGMVNSARGSSVGADGSSVGRERDRGMSSNQRSASGGSGSGNGSVSGGGNGNGNGVERNGSDVERSGGNGIIAQSGGSGGGGGGWRSRGNVSGSSSSSSWPSANSHPSSGGTTSVGAEAISGDRVVPPPGTNRKTRGVWEDRDYWGGRGEMDMRARGRDYGRGRGTELERDDWAYHHQQQRQQWLETRSGPKARSPLTVGGRGGSGGHGAAYPSEVDIEARGGSRDSYGGVIEGTGRGDRPESSPMGKDSSRRAGYGGGASSPHSVKRGSSGSRVNEEREGNSNAGGGGGGGGEDVRSGGAIIDRSDERERGDATSSVRRRSGDDGSSSEIGQKKHPRDGGGMGASSGRSGDGSNYYEIDGDEDGEKRDSWDKNRDLRFGSKGVVESPRRREVLQGPGTSRDETNGQGKDGVRDGGRSSVSGPSGSAVQQQQLKNRWESSDGEMDGGRVEGYRSRRHEEGGEGRRALGSGRGVESGDVRGGGRSGKRAFSSDSPDRGGDGKGGGGGEEDRSKRSKMDRDDSNDYPVMSEGTVRRRSSGGGGDVEMVSPVFDRRNSSTPGGVHDKHNEQQQQQREVGSGFSRGGGRDGSDMVARRWGGDHQRGSDDGDIEGIRKDDRGGWSTSSRRVMTSSLSREGPGGDGVVSSPSNDPATSSTSGRRGPGVGGRSRSRSKEGDSDRQAVERGGSRVGDRSTSPLGMAMAVDSDGPGGTGGDWWGSMRQSCDYCAKKKIKCSGEADRCSR